MTWNLSSRPIQMPQQTATAGYIGNNDWVAVPKATMILQCQEADARGEDCVIMMHPMEFASGNYTLAMLSDVVLSLVSLGWTSINFHTIIQEVYGDTSQYYPSFQPTFTPASSSSSSPIQGTLVVSLFSAVIIVGVLFLYLLWLVWTRYARKFSNGFGFHHTKVNGKMLFDDELSDVADDASIIDDDTIQPPYMPSGRSHNSQAKPSHPWMPTTSVDRTKFSEV